MNKKQIFEQQAKTFSFAAKLLNPQRAEKIFTLYAFCRQVDDLADEAPDKAAAREILLAYQQAIEKGQSDDPALNAFLAFVQENQLDKKYLIDLLAGVLSDCHDDAVRIDTVDDLLTYAYRVAGTVGGLLCPLLGVAAADLPQASKAAIDLGMAMQMTNIARDIQEDAENNRIYLPRIWLPQASPQASIEPLRAKQLCVAPESPQQDARPAQAKLLQLAEKYYQSAWQGYAYLPLRPRLTVLLAAGLYRQIGRKILRLGHPYWQGRLHLNAAEKVWQSFLLFFQVLRPAFWRKPAISQKLSISNDG